MTESAVARTFQSIVCPVDFSSNARLALRYAASPALRLDAQLTVLYVNDPLLVAASAALVIPPTLVSRRSSRRHRGRK